jgi:hypothetical protein
MFARRAFEVCAFLRGALEPARIVGNEFAGEDFGSGRGGHAPNLKQKGPDLHRGLFAFGLAC